MTDRSVARLGSDWLPHRLDPERSLIHFAQVSRTDRLQMPFLSADALASAKQRTEGLEGLASFSNQNPVQFLFHSAYCGSTLLANLLDIEGTATTLKEPQILNDIVGWRRRGCPGEALRSRLDDVLNLLTTIGNASEAVIIKPSNVCNELIEPILELRPEARAIFLFAPLPVYLGSLARKGFWGRRWARELLIRQIEHGLPQFGFSAADYVQHTDLEAAAVGWAAHMVQFTALSRRYSGRVAMLGSETLIDFPLETLGAVQRHFRLTAKSGQIEQLASERLGMNAKDGRPFDANLRKQLMLDSEALHGEEIAMVCHWMGAVTANAGLDIEPDKLLDVAAR